MKYLGYALIAWGLLDFGLSYAGTDVWYDWLGVTLPEAIWAYSGIIEVGLGYLILRFAGGGEEEAEAPSEE